MGFFTEEEQDQLRVTRMILHVIGGPEDPFVPVTEAAVQQEAFFRTRILESAGDAVHRFNEGALVPGILEEMVADDDAFEGGGQRLARLFSNMHSRQASKGAFFVFQLDSANDTRFYALIKYDYRQVVELAQENGQNVLRAIVQAFVKERKAIQKICIVRIVNGAVDPMVSAADRMHQAPDLTDYFAKYLEVSRDRDDAELSDRLDGAMRAALKDIRDCLPEGVGVPAALRLMKKALQAREVVTNADVVDAALHAAGRPKDEKIRSKISQKVRMHLKRVKLDDVEFRPERRIFHLKPREFVRTAEDVRIEYPGEQLGLAVVRAEKDGVTTFTITTRKIVDDGTVSVKPRPQG